MKNWLIEKLGGVSKKDHEEVIQAANSLKNMADDYSQRISDSLKEKAEMEKAAEMVSANLSETISRLNEERKVSNGWDLTCMPKGLSVEDTVNLSNEAFPLLDNQYWKAGEAQKIYKQFGMKWSYL